jgi:hypothetical protein
MQSALLLRKGNEAAMAPCAVKGCTKGCTGLVGAFVCVGTGTVAAFSTERAASNGKLSPLDAPANESRDGLRGISAIFFERIYLLEGNICHF